MDGRRKHLFVSGENEEATNTYIFPLPPGQVLPPGLPMAKGSPVEFRKAPGVRILPIGHVVPGPTADLYAFTRETVQRNLYRIPLR